MLPKRFIAI